MIPVKVRRVLDAHGLSALEFEQGSTPTVETAAKRIGVENGRIAKSLLFGDCRGHIRPVSADAGISAFAVQ